METITFLQVTENDKTLLSSIVIWWNLIPLKNTEFYYLGVQIIHKIVLELILRCLPCCHDHMMNSVIKLKIINKSWKGVQYTTENITGFNEFVF